MKINPNMMYSIHSSLKISISYINNYSKRKTQAIHTSEINIVKLTNLFLKGFCFMITIDITIQCKACK